MTCATDAMQRFKLIDLNVFDQYHGHNVIWLYKFSGKLCDPPQKDLFCGLAKNHLRGGCWANQKDQLVIKGADFSLHLRYRFGFLDQLQRPYAVFEGGWRAINPGRPQK
jgi:hypothetical protein